MTISTHKVFVWWSSFLSISTFLCSFGYLSITVQGIWVTIYLNLTGVNKTLTDNKAILFIYLKFLTSANAAKLAQSPAKKAQESCFMLLMSTFIIVYISTTSWFCNRLTFSYHLSGKTWKIFGLYRYMTIFVWTDKSCLRACSCLWWQWNLSVKSLFRPLYNGLV